MALTKQERDKLSVDLFAFPRTRQCPMPDEKHARMAWDMIATTKGVTDAEKKTAYTRILAHAKTLDIDTSDWNKVKAMSWKIDNLSAMSLDMPSTPDHPNKIPFTGILTRVDQSSDAPPHGSGGRRVYLPSDVAQAALPSLLGMAVNYTPNLSGHDGTRKIGIIDIATIEGSAIMIGGFFYGLDFPEVVSRIQADKEDLGFSFEAERIRVRSMEEDPLVIEELVFTGAAVLQKSTAAYTTTQLAASAEEKKVDKEQFDALMAKLTAMDGRIEKVEASSIKAKSVADKIKPHADTLMKCADDMEAAGIGCDATRGHAATLRHMADSMVAEATHGTIPSRYSGPSMYSSRDVTKDAPVVDPETKKELESLKAGMGDIKTLLTDIQAKAAKGSEPDRKTLPPRIASLLAKANVGSEPEGGGKYSVSKLDAALKGTSLSPQEKIEVKIGLQRASLLDV